MPNIASVLKDEIARVARKEIRAQTGTIKKATVQYRQDIAALKRQVTTLERKVALLEKKVLKEQPIVKSSPEDSNARFTAKGLKSQRKRLGLSAEDYAKLAGVSAQSIYNWEAGATKPRKQQIAVLAALRGIGKKEALARLEQLG